MANRTYRETGALHPSKSAFDLSYGVTGTTEMGLIIPIMVKRAEPGDVFSIKREIVARLNPLVHPFMHEVNIFTYDYFVPFRILDEEFEDKWTGGEDGGTMEELLDANFPKWSGKVLSKNPNGSYINQKSLWDYIGLGEIATINNGTEINGNQTFVTDYLFRAYVKIFEDHFRNQNLEEKIEAPYDYAAVMAANTMDDNRPYEAMGFDKTNLFWGAWEEDRFTTALPWQQRGPSPAIGLLGEAELEAELDYLTFPLPGMSLGVFNNQAQLGFIAQAVEGWSYNQFGTANNHLGITTPQDVWPNYNGGENQYVLPTSGSGTRPPNVYPMRITNTDQSLGPYPNLRVSVASIANALSVNLQSSTAGDINDIRQAFQLQKYLERNARIGSRMNEQLAGRYGVPNLDIRLDRSEFIAGTKRPFLVSEVLQTSESETAASNNNQTGSMRGHGISANGSNIGKYRVFEPGLIMGLMCIKPKPRYSQGIGREWQFKSRLDFLLPEFVNLSETEIFSNEIFANENNIGIDDAWGYQAKYNELRASEDKYCALMRNQTLGSWHLGRILNDPQLCSEFIRINPADTKRVFAVTSEDGILYNIFNSIYALRELPVTAEPGLIDHH